MTRADLVSYVTTKTQMVEPDDILACQLFLSKRYELIFNSYLWKDALTMADISINPATNPDNAVGVVVLPTQIDRVVAIRTPTQSMRIHALEEYYRIDWNRFADISDVNGLMEFAMLNPIWMTCRPNPAAETVTNYQITYGPGPGQYTAQAGLLPAGGYLVTATPGNAAAALTAKVQIGLANTPFNIAWNTPVTVQLAQPGYIIVTEADVTPFTLSVVGATPPPNNQTVGAGSSLTIQSDNVGDNQGGQTPVKIKVTWRDTQNRYTTTALMPLTLTPADNSGFIEIESIFKPITLGNVNLTLNNPIYGYTFSSIIASMLPSDLRSPSQQRVRLLSAPNQSLTLSVLGKKLFVPLDFDQEQPLIQNLDNCLIAFTMADMLQRGRQFSKAAAQMQEATALLSELAKLEVLQAASNQRFIPESGYADSFFSPSSSRGIWT